MSNAAKRHMARIAALPCALCGTMPVEVHHIRQTFGAAQKAPDTLTIPLCVEHHRGDNGIHGLGEKGFRMRYKKDEIALLAETLEKLA
jgi:hypothetical protein